ncbi:VWA domain-containing protein [Patescibacteria group bacterium]|nr:VWA domain-containing protein [Patescibacteria group bacterium]
MKKEIVMCTDDGIERGLSRIMTAQAANDTEVLTLGILAVDRSGSMREVRAETEEALKAYLQDLRNDPNARHILMSVISFADTAIVEVPPMAATDLPESIPFRPHGNTRLYATIAEVLESCLRQDDRQRANGTPMRLVVVVVTDGGDNHANGEENASHAREARRRRLVTAARTAQDRGHTLITIGLNIDAEEIARLMGFPQDSDHAITVKKNREGLRQTMTYTAASMVGVGGYPPRPSSTPR